MFGRKNEVDLILFLAKAGGGRAMSISTVRLAEEIGVSQQTISRWLTRLEREGYVRRGRDGVSLTKKSIDELRLMSDAIAGVYKKAFEIKGVVVRGTGDGRYYLSMPGYRRQVKKLLGFVPYPGTLNLLVENDSKAILQGMRGMEVRGFKKDGRMLGTANLYPCRIADKVDGAVIIPSRSHYGPEIIELIAPHNLRRKLKLRDGDRLRIRIKWAHR